jgi:TrpR family trp operon transcriptional repressor
MSRNYDRYLQEMSAFIRGLESEDDICEFFMEIFTESELNAIEKRWHILTLLEEGKTQREIAQDMHVGLCKITRGAKLLKNPSSLCVRYMKKPKSK